MPEVLDKEVVEGWLQNLSASDEQMNVLKDLVFRYSSVFDTSDISSDTKTAFILYVLKSNASTELQLLQLQMLKIILRDKKTSDLDCFEPIARFLLKISCYTDYHLRNTELLLESERCILNLVFNSAKARKIFEEIASETIVYRIHYMYKRLSKKSCEDDSERFKYLKTLSDCDLKYLYFYDLKISFVISAHLQSIQERWVSDAEKMSVFADVLSNALAEIEQLKEPPYSINYDIASETFSILFNILCHAKIFDIDVATRCGLECAKAIGSNWYNFDLKQQAVNLLATMPLIVRALCPRLEKNSPRNVESYEGHNVEFAKALLVVFEKAIDNLGKNSQLLATFFMTVIHLCSGNKAARRYCRLKIIPPLTAREVEHPPEEGSSLRNKIISLMKNPSHTNTLAAELLFVLCKRSVDRMIKYCGFGHSAGILANYGLLGNVATVQKSASDSEDSETEDYKQVQENVNPVTGYIPSQEQLEEYRRNIDSMSEEQKEYEAMKLANAMSKLMDEGVFSPATIGEDGKPRQVSHVAELVKDVKATKDGDSSDEN